MAAMKHQWLKETNFLFCELSFCGGVRDSNEKEQLTNQISYIVCLDLVAAVRKIVELARRFGNIGGQTVCWTKPERKHTFMRS